MVSIMGSTPRQRTTQIPMPTRSTEAAAECEGRTYLTYLREPDVRPAIFFVLGDVLHRTIEASIVQDFDLVQAKMYLLGILTRELELLEGKVVVEGSARNIDTMAEDADRMITNWFAHVHPDSENRHPFYDDYQWPPLTEVPFYSNSLGTRFPVWGRIDTVFEAQLGRGVPIDGLGYFAIVDWKSGNKRPDSQFQLDYYRFGAELPHARAAYHMLDRIRKSSIVVEAEPYPGDTYIREAISKTERTKLAVVAGVMPKFSPGWQCSYCPVQHVCPADGDPRKRKKNERELVSLIRKAEAMKEIT